MIKEKVEVTKELERMESEVIKPRNRYAHHTTTDVKRHKYQSRSVLDSSPSPKKAALSTQAGDSWYLTSSGTNQQCKCGDKKQCSCKAKSDLGSAYIKFQINKTEQVPTKSLAGSKSSYYTVYVIEVYTCIGEWTLSYRYSELQKFHEYIHKTYRKSCELPKFPSKKIWKNDEKVVNERRLQLTGYMRDYLSDLNARQGQSLSSASKKKKQFSTRTIINIGKIATHSFHLLDVDDESQFDFNASDSEESNGRINLFKNRTMIELRTKKHQPNQLNMNKKQRSTGEITSLISLQRIYNLNDEEVILRFFSNINSQPMSKDCFIRDFEDFYFQTRPQFEPKEIKLLLEGDNNSPGLLFFMSEIEESFVSACSTLQLLSKLLDFQKNIYADAFIKELAKIDPRKMKKYNFTKFLQKENSEGYKQCALNILYAYVEKRKNFKQTLGTLAGQLDQDDGFEALLNKGRKTVPLENKESEDSIVQQILSEKALQEELLAHIRAKQALQQQFSASQTNLIFVRQTSNPQKAPNKSFVIPLKNSIQPMKSVDGIMLDNVNELESNNAVLNKYRSSEDVFCKYASEVLTIEDIFHDFQSKKTETYRLQTLLDFQLLLHHHTPLIHDLYFRFDSCLNLNMTTNKLSDFSYHTLFIVQLKEAKLNPIITNLIDVNQLQIDVQRTDSKGKITKMSFFVQLLQSKFNEKRQIVYAVSESKNKNVQFAVCFREVSEGKSVSQVEAFIKIKRGFFNKEQKQTLKQFLQKSVVQEKTTPKKNNFAANRVSKNEVIYEEVDMVFQTPTLFDLENVKEVEDDMDNSLDLKSEKLKKQVIEKLVEVLVDMQGTNKNQ